MTIEQFGDVLLFQTNDDGNINVSSGITEMTSGFETAVYLSLFGGNEDDNGQESNPKQYWGNLLENQPDRKYRSQTQFLLRSIPISSGNLRRIDEAVRSDLQWLLNGNIASELSVITTIIGKDKIKITVSIFADGVNIELNFVENWKSYL